MPEITGQQIHELQSLPRNPASGDYFAVDTGTITGKTGFDEMQEAIAGPAAAAAAAALGNFAGGFSDSMPYTAGQYVIYTDGKLYRFTADHDAGAWDASEVVAATMGGEVKALKSALENGEVNDLLHAEEINNTVQSIAFDANGNVQSITHTRDNVAIRTDVFTFATGSITEMRTLNTGESLTIVTNTDTLQTTVTYTAA